MLIWTLKSHMTDDAVSEELLLTCLHKSVVKKICDIFSNWQIIPDRNIFNFYASMSRDHLLKKLSTQPRVFKLRLTLKPPSSSWFSSVPNVQTWACRCAPWSRTGRCWDLQLEVWALEEGSGGQGWGQICWQRGAQRGVPQSVTFPGHMVPVLQGPAAGPHTPCLTAVTDGPDRSPR